MASNKLTIRDRLTVIEVEMKYIKKMIFAIIGLLAAEIGVGVIA